MDQSEFGRQVLYGLAPCELAPYGQAPPAHFDLVVFDELLPREEQEALQSL